jgi:hypothetical protein
VIDSLEALLSPQGVMGVPSLKADGIHMIEVLGSAQQATSSVEALPSFKLKKVKRSTRQLKRALHS